MCNSDLVQWQFIKKNIGAIAHDKCMCFVYTHEIHLIKR